MLFQGFSVKKKGNHPDAGNNWHGNPFNKVCPPGKEWLDDPPAADGRKIVVVDTDHCAPWDHRPAWVSKNFTRGHHFILMGAYMDLRIGTPAQPKADGDITRQAMGAARKLSERLDLARLRNAATADGALFAFDFGATKAKPPWKPVQASSTYSPPAGFGWLPAEDNTDPTPEQLYYSMAQKYGAKHRGPEPAAQSLLFWPYRPPIPAPVRMSLSSGASRTFRVNAPPGAYRVRVITTHPAWMNRNFLVSGMVSVNGAVQLLDAPHDRGAVVSREFTVKTTGDHLEFTLGGPTGWAVAALIIGRETNPNPDAQLAGSVRTWHLSPRFANADWYPIAQVSAPPESRLDRLPEATWARAAASAGGLPVIDLGSNRESDIGDVVYAASTIESPTARPVRLHVGASSSAQVWLNGEPIGYVPNEKGVRLDEFVAPVSLRSGRNLLVVKLQRFWERRWLFYARLSTPG